MPCSGANAPSPHAHAVRPTGPGSASHPRRVDSPESRAGILRMQGRRTGNQSPSACSSSPNTSLTPTYFPDSSTTSSDLYSPPSITFPCNRGSRSTSSVGSYSQYSLTPKLSYSRYLVTLSCVRCPRRDLQHELRYSSLDPGLEYVPLVPFVRPRDQEHVGRYHTCRYALLVVEEHV